MTAAGGCANRLAACGCRASPAGSIEETAVLGIGDWGSRQRVSHHVFYPGHIPDVSSILSYVTKLPLLPRRPGVGAAAKSVGEGAMICPQLKLPALYLEAEMPDGAECRQEFSVKGAVRYLSTVQLLGEEAQRLPGPRGPLHGGVNVAALAAAQP